MNKCAKHGENWSSECEECESKAPESARGQSLAITDEPQIKTILRLMIQAIDNNDSDAYWLAFNLFMTLHEFAVIESSKE